MLHPFTFNSISENLICENHLDQTIQDILRNYFSGSNVVARSLYLDFGEMVDTTKMAFFARNFSLEVDRK